MQEISFSLCLLQKSPYDSKVKTYYFKFSNKHEPNTGRFSKHVQGVNFDTIWPILLNSGSLVVEY